MFDDMDVQELCDAIAKAFYEGYLEHAITLNMELTERLLDTGV